jgi:hypothetical protein
MMGGGSLGSYLLQALRDLDTGQSESARVVPDHLTAIEGMLRTREVKPPVLGVEGDEVWVGFLVHPVNRVSPLV